MRPKTSDEVKRAITLRAAGWTLSAIVAETGISASTLQRLFKAHSVIRGGLSTQAIEAARQQLLSDANFIGELKHSIASAAADDLAIVRHIREALALSLEELVDDRSIPATLKARSLAALSTSLKLTQDIQRKALRIDEVANRQVDELTTLVVCKMTDAEIEAAQIALGDRGDCGDLNDVAHESIIDDRLLTAD